MGKAKVGRVSENRDAELFAFDIPGVTNPCGFFAPGILVGFAVAILDPAAFVHGHGWRDAEAKTAFLRLAEFDIAFARRSEDVDVEDMVAIDHVARGTPNLLTDNLSVFALPSGARGHNSPVFSS